MVTEFALTIRPMLNDLLALDSQTKDASIARKELIIEGEKEVVSPDHVPASHVS